MFLRWLNAPAVAALLIVLASCGGNSGDESSATPKPQAWPRLEAYAAEYKEPVADLTTRLELNSAMELLSDSLTAAGTRWLTLSWPRYGAAKLYLTLSQPATPEALSSELANRRKRVSLNMGSASATLARGRNGAGFNYELAAADEPSTATPLQFIAWHPASLRLVTGAVFMPQAVGADADSLAPTMQAITADITHTLDSLK